MTRLRFIRITKNRFRNTLRIRIFFNRMRNIRTIRRRQIMTNIRRRLFPNLITNPKNFSRSSPKAPLTRIRTTRRNFFITFSISLRRISQTFSIFFTSQNRNTKISNITTRIRTNITILLNSTNFRNQRTNINSNMRNRNLNIITNRTLRISIFKPLLTRNIIMSLRQLSISTNPTTLVGHLNSQIRNKLVNTSISMRTILRILRNTPRTGIFRILYVEGRHRKHFLSINCNSP